MDVVGRGTTGAFGIAAKRMECQCYHGVASGCVITFIVCADRYGWQGGRHYSDAAGQCLHGWKDMASALLEPYLYFFVFYDSLYIYKRSEKTYSIYSIFTDSVYNDMDHLEREWK